MESNHHLLERVLPPARHARSRSLQRRCESAMGSSAGTCSLYVAMLSFQAAPSGPRADHLTCTVPVHPEDRLWCPVQPGAAIELARPGATRVANVLLQRLLCHLAPGTCTLRCAWRRSPATSSPPSAAGRATRPSCCSAGAKTARGCTGPRRRSSRALSTGDLARPRLASAYAMP